MSSAGCSIFLTTSIKAQHDWLLSRIDNQQWLGDLKRRVQHYGFKYDYRERKVNLELRIGALPEWLQNSAANYIGMGTCQKPQIR